MKVNHLLSLISLLSTPLLLSAYDSMHEKTPVGKILVLELPSRIALEATSNGSYFDANNGLFRKLFRFISSNDVAMTTPVEADINPAKMRFFVGRNDLGKSLQSNDSVRVIKLSARKVVSIGIRGGYSEEKFRKNKSALNAWLSENDQYEKMGSAYGVYWNGPFMPGFFKRSEVHIPIRKKNQSNKSNKSKNK